MITEKSEWENDSMKTWLRESLRKILFSKISQAKSNLPTYQQAVDGAKEITADANKAKKSVEILGNDNSTIIDKTTAMQDLIFLYNKYHAKYQQLTGASGATQRAIQGDSFSEIKRRSKFMWNWFIMKLDFHSQRDDEIVFHEIMLKIQIFIEFTWMK